MEHVLASPAARPRWRAVLLWLGVTAGVVLGARGAGPVAAELVRAPATATAGTFADLLVRLCAVLALVALGGLWLAASDVAWTVLRPGSPRHGRRVGPVRAGLLALCGVTVVAALGAPAGAVTPEPPQPSVLDTDALDGLPLPDRPAGGAADPDRTVRVRPGDTLWAIAARALGPGASAAEVTSYWQRIHAHNAPVLGPDPDRILPGQVLHLPVPLP